MFSDETGAAQEAMLFFHGVDVLLVGVAGEEWDMSAPAIAFAVSGILGVCCD